MRCARCRRRLDEGSESDPLTRLAPAGESAGGEPPSPHGGEGRESNVRFSHAILSSKDHSEGGASGQFCRGEHSLVRGFVLGMNRDELAQHFTGSQARSLCAAAKWLIIVSIAASWFALGSSSEDLQDLFAQARQLQAKGDLHGAENRYVQFLKLAPRSAEGHANLGVVLSNEGKIDSAVGQYETALRLNPALYGVNLDLGIAYFRKADYLKALTPLQKYLSVRPTSSQARELLGLSYTELDRYQEAIDSLNPLL
jgi:Anaphase-promoting complex, cyclosome, subunit 3